MSVWSRSQPALSPATVPICLRSGYGESCGPPRKTLELRQFVVDSTHRSCFAGIFDELERDNKELVFWALEVGGNDSDESRLT